MISSRGLRKVYGDTVVLDGLDVDIERGERVAIVGLNGAGKTTLFRCILGLTPFQGSLSVADLDVRQHPLKVRSQIGYVPQKAPLLDGTLEEFVRFFAELRGVAYGAAVERLNHLGLDVDVNAGKRFAELSGGMLQKVLLALALSAEVPTLLLDEPTANLDPRARRDFLRALKEVDDTTILLASHRLGDVESVADRVVVLHDGRFVFSGTLSELWSVAETGVTLWMTVAPEVRERAERHLHDDVGLDAIRMNGAALGVAVERDQRADVVANLRGAGIAIDDFWTEAPGLEALLDGMLHGGEDA